MMRRASCKKCMCAWCVVDSILIWFVRFVFRVQNVIAQSVCLFLRVCVYVWKMQKNDASKVHKWNWYAGTFEVFGVSHLLYNSLHSNHRACEATAFSSPQFGAFATATVNNFFKNKWFRFLLFKQANKLVSSCARGAHWDYYISPESIWSKRGRNFI